MHTKDKLATALREAGLHDMAAKAANGYYHDFLSPLDNPNLQLDADLIAAGTPAALALRQRHHDGEFDASREESDQWANSPDGKATFNELAGLLRAVDAPATPPYSDKLKEVMSEIKAVLLKHDVAGIVILSLPPHSEYLCKVDPAWSVARFEALGIRVRAKAEDFGGDKAAQKKAVEDTTNMITHFRDNLAMQFDWMQRLRQMLEQHFDIEVQPVHHTPHREH